MINEQKNFLKQKLNPVSNEGKRKPLLLKGSQQHRRKKLKTSNIRETECLNDDRHALIYEAKAGKI